MQRRIAEPFLTSKIEFFSENNGWKQSTIFANFSILDVWQGYTEISIIQKNLLANPIYDISDVYCISLMFPWIYDPMKVAAASWAERKDNL